MITPAVTGLGGIFFFADNPQALKDWYAKNLGFEFNEWGATSFELRSDQDSDQTETLQWTLFKRGSEYFSPSKKDFMINYRVQNLEGFLIKFKENGVTILDEITSYEYGKFLHIMDIEGNKIELWEPA